MHTPPQQEISSPQLPQNKQLLIVYSCAFAGLLHLPSLFV